MQDDGQPKSEERPSIALIGSRGYPSYYGGFETLVRQLAPYLIDRGWDVYAYGRPGATRPEDPDRDPRVRTITTHGVESESLSTLSFGLTSSLDTMRRRPDLAFVMNVANGYFLPMLKLRGVPTVVNVDGIEWEREKWGSSAKRAFLTGARLTARFATSIVVDSTAIGDRWATEFGRQGETIAYGGSRPGELAPVDDLEPGRYALLVARFVPENTIEAFLHAAEELSAKWDVVLVGSSGYGGELDEWARRLDVSNPRIHWLGHIHDDNRLFSLWQNAGVYFHGHSVGGTNPALVQAMACGVPIVARDTIFNREVLGDAGQFVEPESVAIRDELDKTLSDPGRQQQMRAAALDRQLQHYTWEKVCGAYERHFRRVLENLESRRHPKESLK